MGGVLTVCNWSCITILFSAMRQCTLHTIYVYMCICMRQFLYSLSAEMVDKDEDEQEVKPHNVTISRLYQAEEGGGGGASLNAENGLLITRRCDNIIDTYRKVQ